MKRNSTYWNDIAGYLTGEMNNEQIEKFLLKLQDNQHLKNDYELMQKSWDQFRTNPAERFSDTGKAWNKLHDRMEGDGLLMEGRTVIGLRGAGYYLRIAAVLLLILSVGIPSVIYSVNRAKLSPSVFEYTAGEGIKTVDLPDGSRVFLNEGSNLEFGKDYAVQREVHLKGEGFFDVMSDPQKPFRVNSGKVVVTVLGTSFNVRETGNRSIQVLVESGTVSLQLAENQESVILNPGDLGEAGESISKTKLSDVNYLSWKTKEFKFIDEPLENILDILQKAYHVEVRTGEVELDDKRLTSTYSEQSFDAVLSTICAAFNLDFEKEGKVYILH